MQRAEEMVNGAAVFEFLSEVSGLDCLPAEFISSVTRPLTRGQPRLTDQPKPFQGLFSSIKLWDRGSGNAVL